MQFLWSTSKKHTEIKEANKVMITQSKCSNALSTFRMPECQVPVEWVLDCLNFSSAWVPWVLFDFAFSAHVPFEFKSF